MPSRPSTPNPVGWYASDPSPAVRQPLNQARRRVDGLLGNCAISPMAGRSPKIRDREPMAMRATSTRARVNGTGSMRRRRRVTLGDAVLVGADLPAEERGHLGEPARLQLTDLAVGHLPDRA